jgi:signal peptidase II
MLKDFKNKIKFNVGKKSIILIAVCIVLVLVDLFTKIFEERYGWKFTVIPKLIEVESGSRNPGAAFSFLAEASWGQAFLIAMTFFMLILLIGFFIVLPERFTLLKIAVTLISAGAIGNLIDRIAYNEVRDFVGINMLGNMVSCNFADFWIVFGTIIAIIDLLFINEWALFPLTKRAKEAQAKREKENVEENKSDKDDGRDNG